jgi:hypothetical protein
MGPTFGIKVGVANVCCLIKSKNKDFIDQIKKEYKDFLCVRRPSFILEMNTEEAKVKDVVVRKNDKVVDFLKPAKIVSGKKNKIFITSRYFDGYFNLKRKTGEFVIKIFKGSGLLAFRNVLRLCYSLIFLNKNTVLMHGAGIINKGKGYLFSGPPLSGKSTIAKLSLGKIILNDECVVVRRDEDGVRIYGTPFGGELKPVNKSANLCKVFFIEHDRKTYITKLKELDAITKNLFNNFLFMNIIVREEQELTKKLLKITNYIFMDIPSYELHFNLRDNLWEIINESW